VKGSRGQWCWRSSPQGGREVESLKEALKGAVPHPEVRFFLEEVLSGYPERDIRLFAAARGRERSEKGREALTQAMRELL